MDEPGHLPGPLSAEEVALLSDDELHAYVQALEVQAGAWTLQGKQLIAEGLTKTCDIVGYGGAAGGGKSEWGLWHVYELSKKYPNHRSLVLRRVFPELRRSLIARSLEKFDNALCKYRPGEKEWRFTNNSVIEFGYLDKDDDVYQYKCLTPDHEVLTVNGWKPIAEVAVNEFVASLDPVTREMTYMPVSEAHTFDFDGELVECYQRNGVSFRATPNHTVWASTDRSPRLLPYRADSLPLTARVPQQAEWNDGYVPTPWTFISPGNNGRRIDFQPAEWAEFLGWYIAEGCVDPGRWAIRLAQVGDIGRSLIGDLLDRVGLNWHASATEITFNNRSLCEYLDSHVGKGALDKHLPDEVWGWDEKHAFLLLLALVEADGTWTDGTRKGHFVTASKRLSDDVCTLALRCGYRATVCEQRPKDGPYQHTVAWHVAIRRGAHDTMIRGGLSRVPYKGKVYCLTVPALHTFLIRHRGRISWTGNSAEYDCIFFDEATEFTEFQFDYLRSRCRTAMWKHARGVRPHIIAATNPGGVGHAWFKRRMVLATDHGEVVVDVEVVNPQSGVVEGHRRTAFVPATLFDNAYIDPEYKLNLMMLPDVEMRQLLYGDWDVFAGQFFSDWRQDLHVVRPFSIPASWPRIRAIDYGYAHPFVCLWAAFDGDGTAWVYREVSQTKLTATEQARLVLSKSYRIDENDGDRKVKEVIDYTVADPSIWSRQGTGVSIAAQYRDAGLFCRKAMNARIDGWSRLREWLRPDSDRNGQPMLRVFPNCTQLIEHLPDLVHDTDKPEDIAHGSNVLDDEADCLRYLVMSRPRHYKPKVNAPGSSFDDRIKAHFAQAGKTRKYSVHEVLGKVHL